MEVECHTIDGQLGGVLVDSSLSVLAGRFNEIMQRRVVDYYNERGSGVIAEI